MLSLQAEPRGWMWRGEREREREKEGGEGHLGVLQREPRLLLPPGGLISTPAATSGSLFLLKSASSSQTCGCISAAAYHLTTREPVLGQPGLSGNLCRMWPGGKLRLKGIPRPEVDAHQEREQSTCWQQAGWCPHCPPHPHF